MFAERGLVDMAFMLSAAEVTQADWGGYWWILLERLREFHAPLIVLPSLEELDAPQVSTAVAATASVAAVAHNESAQPQRECVVDEQGSDFWQKPAPVCNVAAEDDGEFVSATK